MKPRMTLVGKVSRDMDTHKTLSNHNKLDNIMKYVRQFFWYGNAYIYNQEVLIDEAHPYPEYFAAGWFVLNEQGCTKQSVIVAHGNSLVDAKNRMLGQANKLNWS